MKVLSYRTGPISVNTYLVYDEESKHGFMIDPGGNFKRLQQEISGLGVVVECILLTHGHFDHAGACASFQKMGIPIYIHERDADKLYTHGNLAETLGFTFETLHADGFLTDGQTLEIARMCVKVLYTPGHTTGGVSFVVRDCLFSGDTLFRGSVGRTDFPGGDMQTLIDSIQQKLFSLTGDYVVYPGHDESTTLDYERVNNPFVEYE